MRNEIESTYDATGEKYQLWGDVRFFQTTFLVGEDKGFGFCVCDTSYDVRTSLLESGFEYTMYYL